MPSSPLAFSAFSRPCEEGSRRPALKSPAEPKISFETQTSCSVSDPVLDEERPLAAVARDLVGAEALDGPLLLALGLRDHRLHLLQVDPRVALLRVVDQVGDVGLGGAREDRHLHGALARLLQLRVRHLHLHPGAGLADERLRRAIDVLPGDLHLEGPFPLGGGGEREGEEGGEGEAEEALHGYSFRGPPGVRGIRPGSLRPGRFRDG
jgi:hypothetical protein